MTEQDNPAPNADAPDEEDTLESKPDAVDDAVIEDDEQNDTPGEATGGDDEGSDS